MARKRRGGGGGGGGAPEWLVTFSDLMSLLCCFFVLIISFSVQDKLKVQVVAGSMREAFGVQPVERKAAMIERDGVPVREYLKQQNAVDKPLDAEFSSERNDRHSKQGPEANTHDIEKTEQERPRQFATAAASLRQAWQDMPDIAEVSKSILMEETKDGLNIQLLDQDGRSMFAEGSPMPYEMTRQLLQRMAPVLRAMPHRIQVTGHTTSGRRGEGDRGWDLSTERALAVRSILGAAGLRGERFFAVQGKADTEPLFPNDPFLAANRRISILLMSEKPPLPPGHQP